MKTINDMPIEELRLVIESAYGNRLSMPSNELKTLINYTGASKYWGTFVFLLTKAMIIKKDVNNSIKVGKRKYYIYDLVKSQGSNSPEKKPEEQINQTNSEEEFLIVFNDTAKNSIKVKGTNSEIKMVISILKKEHPALKAYKEEKIM